MPKNTRRVTVTRTVTFTATIDTVGRPEETDANMLTLLGGAAGNTGQLSIGELLAGSIAANGTISRGNWSVSGTSSNIEPYATRTPSLAMSPGQRIASIAPPTGKELALAKLFVVGSAGTTGSDSAEPSWDTTDGNPTTDGTVIFYTIPKFPTLTNYAPSTAYTKGTILRPSATSMKEYLVTAANSSAASTPTWTSNDTVGNVVAFQNGGTLLCIAGCVTYANLTPYALGDVVKPSAGSSQEYLCTAAGVSDTTALTAASVGDSVTRGSATFKRIV